MKLRCGALVERCLMNGRSNPKQLLELYTIKLPQLSIWRQSNLRFFAIVDGKQIPLEGGIWSLRAQVSMRDLLGAPKAQVVIVKHMPTAPLELWMEQQYKIMRRIEDEEWAPDEINPLPTPEMIPGVEFRPCECTGCVRLAKQDSSRCQDCMWTCQCSCLPSSHRLGCGSHRSLFQTSIPSHRLANARRRRVDCIIRARDSRIRGRHSLAARGVPDFWLEEVPALEDSVIADSEPEEPSECSELYLRRATENYGRDDDEGEPQFCPWKSSGPPSLGWSDARYEELDNRKPFPHAP